MEFFYHDHAYFLGKSLEITWVKISLLEKWCEDNFIEEKLSRKE